MGSWLTTPAGCYLLDWEQGQLDRAVTDAFGFHALQLGLPEVDALRANRVLYRWVVDDTMRAGPQPSTCAADPAGEPAGQRAESPGVPVVQSASVALASSFEALPLPADSIDLVVVPHTLEIASDPHQMLREVERVLRPEGRLVITGFNPASLWGLKQRFGRRRLGLGRDPAQPHAQPRTAEFIGYWRLRDWLRLLGFAIEGGQFGCWRPALANDRWLDRFAWMDRIGERWWPVLGGAYVLVAVKRVKGMRLVGLAARQRRAVKAGAVVAAPSSAAGVHRMRSAAGADRRAEKQP